MDYRAANLHGISRSILKHQLSERVIHGTKSGPKMYLTTEEENELEKYLLQASEIGYGKTRCDVKPIVESHLKENERMKASLSDDWWTKFLQRHPNLRLRLGDATAGVRMDAVNTENLRAYYEEWLKRYHPESTGKALVTPSMSESAPPGVGPPGSEHTPLSGGASPSTSSLSGSAAPSTSPLSGSAAPSKSPLPSGTTSTPSSANCSLLSNLPTSSTPVMPKTGRARIPVVSALS